ncbi:BnaC08g42740D [Brassica napus]|uniref:BnaC08g42740D protein n=1 Tax=Brassica napus TaxID=3708 RepID=A0A078G849_BRANA|nr:PREDICTED: uncharacterized protein LOC106311399 [Brassica oleracea var. oleracea]XP_013615313.1 PREDICTED: uncharacterized protein LOC106321616 [Brassica oleracea var. oleracea]CDY22640.1 BnaC08g42740D [Brassica napus]
MSIVVDVNRVSDICESSSRRTRDESVFEKLKKAAQDGDIEELYKLIAEEQNILDHFDEVPFCETPLHLAAENGKTHFAMELVTLKPSLALKLNVSGFSPIHLALQNNHVRMVLFGWIKRANRVEILDWKDEDGNTVFHIAAAINQTEVMALLRKSVKIAAKNLNGKTAMDIFEAHQPPCFPEARTILRSAKERLFSCSTITLAEYLSKDLTFLEKRNNFLGLSNLSISRARPLTSSHRRDAIYVVVILIITTSFQAGFSPPGGFWQEDGVDHHNVYHKAGQMTMSFSNALIFNGFNGFAFLSSLYVIMILTIGLPMWKLIYCSTACLGLALLASYGTIFPYPDDSYIGYIPLIAFVYVFPLIITIMLFSVFMAFIVDKRGRRLVDFPASCFSSSHELSL